MERRAGARAGRILRRAFVLALFAFGWLLCTAGAASATTGPDDAKRPVIEVDLPGLVTTVDHTLRGLARTVEDMPRTVRRAIAPASPAGAVDASPEAAHGATPRVFERPGGPARQAAAHQPQKKKHRARVARPTVRHAASHRAGRPAPVRHTTIRLVHHQKRGPAPIAPAAPESLTVGSAAQSSGAAGPAVPLLPGTEHRRDPAFARDEARHSAPEPATAPRGLPDCTPD